MYSVEWTFYDSSNEKEACRIYDMMASKLGTDTDLRLPDNKRGLAKCTDVVMRVTPLSNSGGLYNGDLYNGSHNYTVTVSLIISEVTLDGTTE